MEPKPYRYFALFLLLLMPACNSGKDISHTPAFTLTATSSISSTPTLHFTVTPSWTLSPSDLTQQSYRSDIWAMLDARNVKCKGSFHLELSMQILGHSNEDWTVFTCSPPPQNNREGKGASGPVDYGTRYTQLVKKDLSKSWIIEHNRFDYSIIDRQDAFMDPFRWTADGQYLYLYPDYYPGPSGGSKSLALATLINSLYRVNLENGDFEPVISASEFSALAISPDDRFIVYSDWDEPDHIRLRDLETAKDLSVDLDQEMIASGGFVWSPESEFVVFVAAQGSDVPDSREDMASTSVFVLTIENMKVQEVLSQDPRLFIPSDCFDGNYWSDKNTLCLYSINDNLDSWNKYFSIDIRSGEVIYLRPFP